MGSGLSNAAPSSTQIPLDVLTDKGLQKRLKQFDQAKTAAQETIDLAGKAGDILRMRDDLVKEVAEQEEITAHARAECERLITEAGEAAARKLADAGVETNKLFESAKKRTDASKKVEASARIVQQDAQRAAATIEAARRDIEVRDKALIQRTLDLENQETQLLKEKSKLATVREHIDSILG